MGLMPFEFWRLSWADFQIKAYYFSEKENRAFRTSWEQTRALAQVIISSQGSKEDMFRIWEFEWEKEGNKKRDLQAAKKAQMSEKEISEIVAKANQFYGNSGHAGSPRG